MKSIEERERHLDAAINAIENWDGHNTAELFVAILENTGEVGRDILDMALLEWRQRARQRDNPEGRYTRRPIRCVEDGQVFKTLKLAAESVNGSTSGLWTSLKMLGGLYHGKHFEYVQETAA